MFPLSQLRRVAVVIIAMSIMQAAILTLSMSMFLLGDSTSERLFVHGLIQIFNCNTVDPNIKLSVESVNFKDYGRNKGMLCTSKEIVQIGYIIHWGIARQTGDYSHNWNNHRSPGDTENSVSNILNGLKEFQHRSQGETEVVFLFLSNLWDQHRHYTYHPDVPLQAWLREFHRNYTIAVGEIMEDLRQNDTLVLQTQHHVKESEQFASTINAVNEIIKQVAKFFDLPVFDVEHIAGNNTASYLADGVHQNKKMSETLARLLGEKQWHKIDSPRCSNAVP